MSEKTLKLEGWSPQSRPDEDTDMLYHRQMLVEIVFGLYRRKKELLAKTGMPPQPISLGEIFREYLSRVATLESIGQWKCKTHSKRWIDRRINECACPTYSDSGEPRIVAAKAGLYEPNPKLFRC